jgi:type IV pilus assembly protein PilA
MKAQMQKGFTLIELMIVVAIIGILAAIALPAYQDYMGRSQMTEAMTLASGAKTSVAEFYSNKGEFPIGNESAGLAASITGKYVDTVEVDGGVITATIKTDGVAAGLAGLQLVLSPTTSAGSVTWKCYGAESGTAVTGDKLKYYPSSCRN